MSLIESSGWDLVGYSAVATTADVGIAIGGGRFQLDIVDPRGNRRELRYVGATVGAGAGVHVQGNLLTQLTMRFILPLFRGAVNSLDLPSTTSRLFSFGTLFGSAPSLTWDGDFRRKHLIIYSIGVGAGLGASGSLIVFYQSLAPGIQARAIAFTAGMQMGQLGADATGTACFNYL